MRRMIWFHDWGYGEFDLKYPWKHAGKREYLQKFFEWELDPRSTYTFSGLIIQADIPTESAKEATKIIYDSYRKRPHIIYWLSRELVEKENKND